MFSRYNNFGVLELSYLILACSICTSQAGRYKAKDASEVIFSYKRIPTLDELIHDAGYQYSSHRVTTEDGHILSLLRLNLEGVKATNESTPVLIINGFTFQSDGWLALGNSSLPFVLATLGYDVWLGDQRGNSRSLDHVNLSVHDFRSHNYTFHEQGIYDLPAFIDHILKVTERNQILYVGYSLSCGMMIVMNSERPEYNDKVLGAVFLAPAGHLRKLKNNPIDYAAGVTSLVMSVETQIRRREWLFPSNLKYIKDSYLRCSISLMNPMCQIFIYSMYGVSDTMDPKTVPYQFAITATTTSTYVAKHMTQVIKLGRFAKYDHGCAKNFKVYGTESPPDYDFNSTTVPIYLFYGGADKMVTPDAAKRTAKELGNLVNMKFIWGFNHADFLFSSTAPQMVYEDVVEYFDSLVTSFSN
ncbi:hypothetical protein GE061_003943 [Apolygus lucorum]|uniref:Lipase n=1 Tax=Apolygus lucorum TaxID=248454 RepID=A0A8S9WXT5_APOLU|nr:hypothetical protein GE061_003943 [Apolygus lucorum]